MTLMIEFPVHTIERTADSQAILNDKRWKFSKNCTKLMQFWQSGKWYWLSDDDCRELVGVRNITQRVADLRHINKIPIESRLDEKGRFKRYRLKCTCRVIHGEMVRCSCYVHDPLMKIK